MSSLHPVSASLPATTTMTTIAVTGPADQSSQPHTAESSSPSPLECARSCWARIKPQSAIYSFLLSDVEITHASHGFISARLPLTSSNLLNSKGGLHGSVSATIVDWAGGIAIASTGLLKTGVSTDIHVSYVSSARLGDSLVIEGNVLRLGRNLAFTTVTIYKEINPGPDSESEHVRKEVVCHGTHTKYVLRDQPEKPAKPS